jgi:hypothetical protein
MSLPGPKQEPDVRVYSCNSYVGCLLLPLSQHQPDATAGLFVCSAAAAWHEGPAVGGISSSSADQHGILCCAHVGGVSGKGASSFQSCQSC